MICIYFVELRHVCSNSEECDEGMLCSPDVNNTKPAFGNRNQPQVCLCNSESGYSEDVEDNTCNGKLFVCILVCATDLCYVIVLSFFLWFDFASVQKRAIANHLSWTFEWFRSVFSFFIYSFGISIKNHAKSGMQDILGWYLHFLHCMISAWAIKFRSFDFHWNLNILLIVSRFRSTVSWCFRAIDINTPGCDWIKKTINILISNTFHFDFNTTNI